MAPWSFWMMAAFSRAARSTGVIRSGSSLALFKPGDPLLRSWIASPKVYRLMAVRNLRRLRQPLDLDPATKARLGEIIGRLHAHHRVGAHAEGLLEPQRHFGGERRPPVEHRAGGSFRRDPR